MDVEKFGMKSSAGKDTPDATDAWDAPVSAPRAPSTPTPAVRRIDHLIIRVDDAAYDDFFALFAETLRLPTPWAPTEYPALRSGGIFAGNVDLELLYLPSTQIRTEAQLYGIAFEGWTDERHELARRKLDVVPLPPIKPHRKVEGNKPSAALGTNYFLPGLIGSTPWQKLLFALKKVIPDRLWVRRATQWGTQTRALQFLFNQVYRQGMVFVVNYPPAWRDIDAERRISAAQLEMRAGGAVGLVRVKEVVVGTTQLTQTSVQWRKLLRPAFEETGLCWQVGEGPALRLIAAEQDGLHHMVWEVASLVDAQTALAELGLLGVVLTDEISLDPTQCYGLDIRLVEAPGGFYEW
jgi:hypothetical protein